MNTRSHTMLIVAAILVASIALIVLSNVDMLEACNGGKCADPLPTKAKACEAPGVGPVHKCTGNEQEPEATSTPAPPTSEPPVEAEPTLVHEDEPTAEPAAPPITVTVVVTSTAEPASLPASEPACGLDASQAGCDACAVVREALAQGKIIMIADEDHISILRDDVVVSLTGPATEPAAPYVSASSAALGWGSGIPPMPEPPYVSASSAVLGWASGTPVVTGAFYVSASSAVLGW